MNDAIRLIRLLGNDLFDSIQSLVDPTSVFPRRAEPPTKLHTTPNSATDLDTMKNKWEKMTREIPVWRQTQWWCASKATTASHDTDPTAQRAHYHNHTMKAGRSIDVSRENSRR